MIVIDSPTGGNIPFGTELRPSDSARAESRSVARRPGSEHPDTACGSLATTLIPLAAGFIGLLRGPGAPFQRESYLESLGCRVAGVKDDCRTIRPRARVGSRLANTTQALQAALLRAALPRQRFHDLRDAYATLMLEAGEELGSASRSLGHSNLSTTADIYADVTPASSHGPQPSWAAS